MFKIKLVLFTLMMLFVSAGSAISETTGRKRLKYEVEKGNSLSYISKELQVPKDSLICWNRELVKNNEGRSECIKEYPFRAGDEIFYYKTSASAESQGNVTTSRDSKKNDEDAKKNRAQYNGVFRGNIKWPLWLILGFVFGFVIGKGKNLIPSKKTGSPVGEENNAPTGSLMRQGEIDGLSKENERLKKRIESLLSEIDELRQKKRELLNENVELGERLDAAKDHTCSKSQNEVEIPSKSIQKQQSENGTLYAMAIIDGGLQRVKENASEETIFELRLKGDSRADLDIYRPACEKILADVSFLDGCDKQVVGNTSVSVAEVGEAVKDSNGIWRVTKKIKVIVR